MTFEEFKNTLREKLKESFPEYFYVYEDDSPEMLQRIDDEIEVIINKFVYVDKTVTEEELFKHISDGLFPISDTNIKEDLECIIDDKISELIWWGENDNMWAVREKGSINDEYSENYLDLK